MTRGRMRPDLKAVLIVIALIAAHSAAAQETTFHFDGHLKGRLTGQTFPDNSVFEELTGPTALDAASILRVNFEGDRGPWSLRAAYQLFALYGDRVDYSRDLPAAIIGDRLPDDRRRLFDLTAVIRDQGRFAALHRLDRLWFGYTGERTVLRFGRQAISWGNGFFFSPMDIVNPFDPTTIDTEYKAGDDMLYAQFLARNGDDMQAAVVIRRDVVSGDVEADEGTVSAKYHGISGDSEYDVLIARHYGDLLLGIGGNRSIGGAVLRGDLVLTDTSASREAQLVTNLSYSWMWGGKNLSGVLEYFFNGFGQADGRYDPASLAMNPELLKRIARGDIFTLGRHYVAGGLTVEMNPLWTLAPNLFANLEDLSAFLQIVTQRSLGDNVLFLGALNIPLGPDGSEYGGIESGMPGRYFSQDLGAFAQFAWYF